MRKRILILLAILFISYLGFSHYQLSVLNDRFEEMIKTADGKINWKQKLTFSRRIEAEVSLNKHTFQVTLQPSYYGSAIFFTLNKDASSFVAEYAGINIDLEFDHVYGHLKLSPHVFLTLNYENINLLSIPYSFDDLIDEKDTFSIKADNLETTIIYPYLSAILTGDVTGAILSQKAKNLNIDNSFSFEKLEFDSTKSTQDMTVYSFSIDNMKDINSKFLLSACKNFFSASEDAKRFCKTSVLSHTFPLDFDLFAKIDNSILLGKPENGKGTFTILSTSPIFHVHMAGDVNQSTKLLDVKVQSEMLVTNKERLLALTKETNPNYNPENLIEKENSSIRFQTNPYTFNPLVFAFGIQSKYAASSEDSKGSVSLDKNSATYIKLNDQYIPPLTEETNPEDLSLVGQISIGHHHIAKILSDRSGLNINPNDTIEIYQIRNLQDEP